MTREEKANKLGQEYFPDESNIWARANFEAQWVSEACIKMAEWEHKRLVEKACQYLQKVLGSNEETQDLGDLILMDLIADFRKAMEE